MGSIDAFSAHPVLRNPANASLDDNRKEYACLRSPCTPHIYSLLTSHHSHQTAPLASHHESTMRFTDEPASPVPKALSSISSLSRSPPPSGPKTNYKRTNFLLNGNQCHFTWNLTEGEAAISSPPSDPNYSPEPGDIHLHINTTLRQTKANCQCWLYYGDEFHWCDITKAWIADDKTILHPLHPSHMLHRQSNRLNPNYIVNPKQSLARSKSPSSIPATVTTSGDVDMSLAPITTTATVT